jgi:transcriptional regulator GlxA family with amidase domain
MTKSGAKSVISVPSRFEVALVHDAGTTKGGLYGLTDLFTYANEFATRRQGAEAPAPVRISHWFSDENEQSIRCTFDTCPEPIHVTTVVIIPNNHRAIVEPERASPFVEWLRDRHTEGAVLAAVCGGVFMLAKTGLLSGR